jgi:hypothetical protein
MQDIPTFPAHKKASTIRIPYIASEARNNSPMNIRNMVKVLNFGVMSKKVNAETGKT